MPGKNLCYQVTKIVVYHVTGAYTPLAPVTINNNFKWRSSSKFSYICCIFNPLSSKYVKMGTFTPLVFCTNMGMGAGCRNFLTTLAYKLTSKNNEVYANVISWLRIQLSFAILRTVHRCVRGSRIPFKSRAVANDFYFSVADLLYS